ncbi:N-acetylglucosamine-6-phosphate deacetylase [Paenibacillus sp. JMULE4]|uniref:N-acetylglucosamine-6-phosphate deacetylase n=1 Tax=Paenibacillus naphthalenovorans TaxID=162209 RepID=UPI003D288251|nr:N-acetylglucosamine-6-phosphate deacetylase [Paenibacillus sp. JMULE4]
MYWMDEVNTIKKEVFTIETNPREIYGSLVSTGEYVCVSIVGERIFSVTPAEKQKRADNEREVWICPGLIDLQINGFAGYDLNRADADLEERVEAIRQMTREVLRTGTTSFCPTIITAGFEQIHSSLTAIRLACSRDPIVDSCVLGVHLEGPYLSDQDGPRGAHPREHIKDPDWEEFTAWQEASGGRIRMVTLAPERTGAVEMIRRLVQEGILVCIGHTAASHDEIIAAADAGARMSTHLGNGAHAQLPRHPNYIWSQLSDDRLTPGIISDGHHLHPSVMKVMARAKNNQIVLVSDAVHLAHMKPGIYKTHVGGEVELLPSGRLQMVADPLLLAGAAVSLADCVQTYMRLTSASLHEAIRLATIMPARLIGEPLLGQVRPNGMADLLTFTLNPEDGRIDMLAVTKRGQTVYSAAQENL